MANVSPKEIFARLHHGLSAAETADLVEQIRAAAPAEELASGKHWVEETTVLWALDCPGPVEPVLVTRTYTQDGSVWTVWEAPQTEPRPDILAASERTCWRPERLGDSPLFMVAARLPNFSATAYRFEIGANKPAGNWIVLEHFRLEPACLPQPGVPAGSVTEYILPASNVFPGTVRGYWVYIPAQYQPAGPAACLMVFQDAGLYLNPPAPVPTIFDNLIHAGEMPITVGVFVNPGTFPDQPGRFQNRSFEYDTLSDQYARFLRDELLPQVNKIVNLRTDAASHAIAGISSGAACAFTAAWEKPDLFSKVLSHVGSFTNIRGANSYWATVRAAPARPLRIYLQDGSNDIDDICGNWPLANQELAAAFKFRGYDYRFDYGRGFHSLAHGGAILPSALRWLWRDHLNENQ